MSATRNKRKRSENDTSGTFAPSRRRSREQRASAASLSGGNKNEAANVDSNLAEENAPETQQLPRKSNQTTGSAAKSEGENSKGAPDGQRSPSASIGEGSNGKPSDTQSAVVQNGSSSTSNKGPEASQPLDEVDPTSRQEQKSSNVVATGQQNARASRLQDILSHRKLLLARIRLCRVAAEKRVESGRIDGGIKELSGEEEIASFREMISQATQAAKKSRSENDMAEKRTSLSLRRGSSVGKRMNAALSSLAPGSGGSFSAEVAAAAPGAPGANAISSKPVAVLQSGSIPSVPRQSPVPSMSSNEPMEGSQTISSQSTIGLNNKVPTQTVSSMQPRANGMDALPRARSSSLKNSKAFGMNNRQSSSAKPDPIAMPLHMAATTSSLPPNRLSQPKVFFPEAIALREKREYIQTRLTALLQSKKQKSFELSKLKSFHDPLSLRHRKNPKLPDRRKTHWDVVLQEMSWMAADFIEERKWKISAARTISSTIPDRSHALGSSTSRDGLVEKAIEKTPSDNGVDEKDSVAIPMEVDEKEKNKKRTRKKSKQVSATDYAQPTAEDFESSKMAGKRICAMISDLSLLNTASGAAAPTGAFHIDSLSRFREAQSKFLGSNSDSVDPNSSTKQNDPAVRVDLAASAVDTKLTSSMPAVEESSYDAITTYIDDIHKSVDKNRLKASTKDIASAVKGGKANFSSAQKEALGFAEKIWGGNPSLGGVLIGPPVCGKTFTACSLLWKQRMNGPQILVCPPNSMLRWKHELSRFLGLRILIFGLSCGSTTDGSTHQSFVDPKVGDVVICEYALVGRFVDVMEKHSSRFRSVVVDCRHPTSFFESLGKQIETNPSFENVNGSWYGPKELLSTNWWNQMIRMSHCTEAHFMLIEYTSADILSLSKSGLGAKHQLEIIASRAALLIGPRLFGSLKVPIQRRTISWARQKGKSLVAEKVARVRMVLESATSALIYRVPESAKTNPGPVWHLRQCHMQEDQRAKYDACCTEIRGALSTCLQDNADHQHSQSFDAASSALLRLRQQCNFSNGAEKVVRDTTRFADGICLAESESSRSPAQTDATFAKFLMAGSSKLRELVSILKCECGCDLEGGDVVGALLGSERKGNTQSGSSKVAILATLPGARIIISSLLHSLGIRHELLDPLWTDNTYRQSPGSLDSRGAVVNWSQYQIKLSSFNDGKQEGTPGKRVPPHIIVASPIGLASWNQGLGLETVDTLVSFDEDWSGREQFLVSTLTSRIHAYNAYTKTHCKLLRLLCADTLEAKIFSDAEEVSQKSAMDSWQWPCDKSGFLVLPKADAEATLLYQEVVKNSQHRVASQFPALKLLHFRGRLLADVLLPSVSVPPVFTSGSPVRFLPHKNLDNPRREREVSTELAFIRTLLRYEDLGSTVYTAAESVENSVANFYCDGRLVIPWDPTGLSNFVISRQELKSLAALLYFEAQCKQGAWASTHEISAVGHHASYPRGARNVPLVGSSPPQVMVGNQYSGFADALGGNTGCAGDDQAASLLFYSMTQHQSSKKLIAATEPSTNHTVGSVDGAGTGGTKPNCRFNAYAKLFSASWNAGEIQDGNQGCEPLVYFPPLFHGLLGFRAGVKHHPPDLSSNRMSHPSGGRNDTVSATDQSTTKRKDTPSSPQPNSKRMRFQDNGSAMPSASTVVDEKPPATDKLPEGRNQLSEAASTLEIAEQSQNKLQPGTRDDAAVQDKENWSSKHNGRKRENRVFSVYEDDYGLLGGGETPLPSRRAIAGMKIKSGVRGCGSSNSNDTLSNAFQCDFEESENHRSMHGFPRLDSILLFVKTKSRPFGSDQFAPAFRPAHINPISDTVLPTPNVIQGVGNPLNKKVVEESGKKAKKKPSIQGTVPTATSPFARPLLSSGHATPSQSVSVIQKNGHRHRLHASFISRHFGTGLSMFESTSFQVASLHVERRVLRRMEELGWKFEKSFETDLGIPVHSKEKYDATSSLSVHADAWTRIVKPLGKNASSPGAAKILSSKQRSAMLLSVSPSRVDFGPFGGYIAGRSGMAGISIPRSRLGVSLPMGVKVPQSSKDRNRVRWTTTTDNLLRKSVLKFGMNWMLVSRTINGVDSVDLEESQHIEMNQGCKPFLMTARQCRDRWQELQGSVVAEVRESERLLRERSLGRPEKIESDNAVAIRNTTNPVAKRRIALLQTFSLCEDNVDTRETEKGTSSTTSTLLAKESPSAGQKYSFMAATNPTVPDQTMQQHRRVKRSFSSLIASRSKRQIIPINIPGVVSGSQQSQPVPSHHSHLQSVQTSVASQWSNGRTEMWPLQILDFADKHRSVSRTPSSVTPASSSSTRRPPPSHSHRPPSHVPPSRDRQFAPVPPSTGIPGTQRPPPVSNRPTPVSNRPTQPPIRNAPPPTRPSKTNTPPVAAAAPTRNAPIPSSQVYAPPKPSGTAKVTKPGKSEAKTNAK